MFIISGHVCDHRILRLFSDCTRRKYGGSLKTRPLDILGGSCFVREFTTGIYQCFVIPQPQPRQRARLEKHATQNAAGAIAGREVCGTLLPAYLPQGGLSLSALLQRYSPANPNPRSATLAHGNKQPCFRSLFHWRTQVLPNEPRQSRWHCPPKSIVLKSPLQSVAKDHRR